MVSSRLARLALYLSVAICAAGIARAEQIHLTNAEMLDVQAGLRELGGMHQVIIKEGGADKSVSVPYKLRASVVDAIARNLVALKPMNDALESTKNMLAQQIAAAAEGKERFDLERAKNEEFRALMLKPVTVELTLIDPKELDREGAVSNPIPALVMAQLGPILTKAEDKK